jgi:outer membrane protein assembly factor BamA
VTLLQSLFSLLLAAALVFAQTHPRKPRSTANTTQQPQTSTFPLETLKVTGNQNFTAEQVLSVAGLKLGAPVTKDDFEAARNRLLATGVFDIVGYRYEPAKDGKGYDGVFEVTEMKQLFPLRFEELPATDAELRGWLKQKDPLFAPKIPATQPELDRYTKLIAEFLAAKDYHEPVIGKLTPDIPPELVIVFRPAAPHPSVARVKFTDGGPITAETLQKEMYQVAVGSIYTEPNFRTLLDTTIRPLYEARGQIRVSFPKIQTEEAKDVKGVIVIVSVDPGPVYKLGKVAFIGAREPQQPYEKLAKLEKDETVNFDQVKVAQKNIEDSFRRSGFLQVKSEVKRTLHDPEKTVDVTFQMTPGPQFTFGKLSIVGLDLVSEPVIRKMWGLEPGHPFNPDYPNHFLDRVKEDGVFDNLKNTRSDTKINPENQVVDVTLYFNK